MIHLINLYIFLIRPLFDPFPLQSGGGHTREGVRFLDPKLIGIMSDLIVSFSSHP